MATLSLRLPESLHKKLSEVAAVEGISLNQFIASAAGEKLAALLTEDYLRTRAIRASEARLDEVLSKIPAEPPLQGDELPAEFVKGNNRSTRSGRGARRAPAA